MAVSGPGAVQLEDADRRVQRDVPRAGHPPRDAADVRRRERPAAGLAPARQARAVVRPAVAAPARRADDQQVWESFVEIMGVRVGNLAQTRRGARARGARRRNDADGDRGDRARRAASRPGTSGSPSSTTAGCSTWRSTTCSRTSPCSCSPTCCRSCGRGPARRPTTRSWTRSRSPRVPAGDPSPRTKPADIEIAPGRRTPARARARPGLRELRAQRSAACTSPGLTHLTVSPTEECRIVNLHEPGGVPRIRVKSRAIEPSTKTQRVRV